MGTTGKAMVAGVLLSLYCSVALAGCDISLFDRASPPAIRGGVSNPLVDFDYASDVDAIRGINYLWNYVRNRLIDRGIGIAWPKAGIAQSLWAPLPPGEIACKFDQVSEIRTDSDAPITYGTTDEK